MSVLDDIKAAITRAAREGGVDPKYALAVAQRESNFNPMARSSKTIAGIYQMRGDHRMAYGAGDSKDPYTQAMAWTGFINDVKGEMSGVLGRQPTDAESYLGHHFGGVRAARMMRMDPKTPVDTVFTPDEMAINPHIGRAGTVGALNRSVMADIDRRAKTFDTGEGDLPSAYGEPVNKLPSEYGEPIQSEAGDAAPASVPTELLARPDQAPPQSGARRDAPPAAAPILQSDASAGPATIPTPLLNSLGA